MYCPRLSIKFTAFWVAKPAVHVQRHSLTVAGQNCAVGAVISTDIDKLGENTRDWFWKLHKKVQISKGDPPVIPVVHAICWKITSGSPVGGELLDWCYTGHWQTVAVPFRCILIDWHVMHVEWFIFERVIVLEGVGLDQSPCHARLRTKVAVDWKQNVVVVHNVVDSIGFQFWKFHDVRTWTRLKLTPVSAKGW